MTPARPVPKTGIGEILGQCLGVTLMSKGRLEAFSDGVIAIVGLMWIVPDRRVERVIRS